MGYPEKFQGFMIEDQKKWTEFKKQEVPILGALESLHQWQLTVSL